MNTKGLLWSILIVSLLGGTACDRKAKLDNDKSRYSYAVGHQVGRNIKGQEIDLDVKAFAQAVNDVMAGKELAMNDQEMREALRMMAEKRREQEKADAERNLKVGQEFLEKNKANKDVVTTESGLQYQVLTKGKGPKPKPNDTVEVHYRGTLIDGTEFDSSYKRQQAAQFPVKAVIPGWTEALQLMNVGSKYKLFIPPNLAYGEHGNPTIPGNSVLIFEVELLDIKKSKTR